MYCQIVIVVTIHEIIDFSGLKTRFSLKRNLTLVFHNREENLFINTVLLFKFINQFKNKSCCFTNQDFSGCYINNSSCFTNIFAIM